jgi:hypothetical protein
MIMFGPVMTAARKPGQHDAVAASVRMADE